METEIAVFKAWIISMISTQESHGLCTPDFTDASTRSTLETSYPGHIMQDSVQCKGPVLCLPSQCVHFSQTLQVVHNMKDSSISTAPHWSFTTSF